MTFLLMGGDDGADISADMVEDDIDCIHPVFSRIVIKLMAPFLSVIIPGVGEHSTPLFGLEVQHAFATRPAVKSLKIRILATGHMGKHYEV